MRNFVKASFGRTMVIAWQSKWSLISAITSVFVAFSILWVWSHYLAPAQLGELALWITIPSLLHGVFLQPIIKAMVVSHANYPLSSHEKIIEASRYVNYRRLMTITSIMLTVALVSSIIDVEFSRRLFMVTITLILDVVREFKRAVELVGLRQRSASLIYVSDSIAKALGLFAGVLILADVDHAILGNLIGTIFSSLFLLNVTGFRFSTKNTNSDIEKNEIINSIRGKSNEILPGNLLVQLQEVGPRYLMVLASTAHETGLFVLAFGLIKRPLGLLRDFGPNFFLPEFVRSYESGSERTILEKKLNWLYFISAGSAFGFLFCCFFSDYFVRNFLSPKYFQIIWLLTPLAAAVGIGVIASVYDELLIFFGDVRFLRQVVFSELIFSGALFFFFSASFGAIGGAAALGFGSLCHLVLVYYRSKSSMDRDIEKRFKR